VTRARLKRSAADEPLQFDECLVVSSELFRGQSAERLTSPPDDWGGRAAAEWVRKLAAGERFAGTSRGLIETARVLDRLYGRSGGEFR